MNMRKILLTILSFLPLAIYAQTKITFDTDPADYKTVGVYDTWENSPFRTGTLKGNAEVIENFTKGNNTSGVDNETDYIAGVQRSRFGSNTFGIRVDLNTPFATSETTQYVHVLVYKPNTSGVLLVGLGKRTTSAFTDEPTTVEQFWVESNYSYTTANTWIDMVFPVKTVTGVEIYSLVIVPDLQSPHNYTSDFACYIDQIEVNSSSAQRTGSQTTPGDYPINFDNQNNSRPTERYLKGISLTGGSDNVSYSQTIASSTNANSTKVYNDLTGSVTWDVKPGGTYTPAVDYQGTWMHSYAYIDYNNDGQFTPVIGSNHGAGSGSEAVSWSCYSASSTNPLYDSNGTSYSDGNRDHITMPSFTIPSSTTPGIYRMRFKVDWNCIDPGGGDGSDNTNMQSTISNGGGIVDILLNVHDDNIKVNSSGRNGTVTASDGAALNDYSHPFKTQLGILVTPAAGFDNDNIEVMHGYNLDGKQYVHHNRQWQSITYEASQFGTDGAFTLPATIIDGNVNITGNFKQKDYIILDESSEMSDAAKAALGSTVNIQLNRTFSTTAYNTLVLPFALSAEQISSAFGSNAKVYSFSGDTESHVSFISATETKANVPFLITTSTEESSFKFDQVALEDATPTTSGNYYDFVGNYNGKITLPEGAWFLNSNTFYRSVGKSTLKGYRAYFEPKATTAKSETLGLNIDGTTTGIESVVDYDGTHGDIYNISGQKMHTKKHADLPKGVYIEGHNKVIIK